MINQDNTWAKCKERHILQSKSEFMALLNLMDRVTSLIEIGCCYGGATVGFYEALKERCFQTRFCTIDTEDHFKRNPESLKFLQEKVIESAHYQNELILTVGNSCDADTLIGMKKLFLEGVDMVFIDGDHSYNGVKNDYECYRGLVKDGGLIVFHDLYMDTVGRFWKEITESTGWETLILNQRPGYYGIGILKKNVVAGPLPDISDMTY